MEIIKLLLLRRSTLRMQYNCAMYRKWVTIPNSSKVIWDVGTIEMTFQGLVDLSTEICAIWSVR